MVRTQRTGLEIVSVVAIQDLSWQSRAQAHRQTVQTTKLYLPAQIAWNQPLQVEYAPRGLSGACGPRINRGRPLPL